MMNEDDGQDGNSMLGNLLEAGAETMKEKGRELAEKGREALADGRKKLEEMRELYEEDPEAFEEEMRELIEERAGQAREKGEELVAYGSDKAFEALVHGGEKWAQNRGYTDIEEARQEYGLSAPSLDVYDEAVEEVELTGYRQLDFVRIELEEDALDSGEYQIARKAEAYLRSEGAEDGVELAIFERLDENEVNVNFYEEQPS